jgi:hypothetical protein
MSMVALESHGFWTPVLPGYMGNSPTLASSDLGVLDADEEELQCIGEVRVDGGGSKTFGLSSKIGWLVGAATITFATGSTLRVGVKKTSSISVAAGPPPRATIGAAAFDVYDNLVGGTDTLTALAWREETMTAGTPFTVTNGDLLAVCFHLDVTSGTPSVKIRQNLITNSGLHLPALTLVTTGPTYTAQALLPNILLVFDDGTLGWLEPCRVFSVADLASATIGSGNAFGNIMQEPYAREVDALGAYIPATGTPPFALELYSSPLATPVLLDSLPHDSHVLASAGLRFVSKILPVPRSLSANTPYAVAVKQTSATALTITQWDVSNAAYFKPSGMGVNCYAANKTGAGAFVSQNSGRRRYLVWMRISAVDDGAGGGALRTSRPPKREALRFARSSR